MSTKTIINSHQTPTVPTDPNLLLEIVGRGESAGGAHDRYEISNPQLCEPPLVLVFQTLDHAGITNEALLAIAYDRLRMFQGGSCPCDENERAMGHIAGALHNLKNRTTRRHAAGLEGKVAEDAKAEPENRVHYAAYKLRIGTKVFDVDDLKMWKMWSAVEAACKRLDPPLSPLELSVIEGVARACDNGGNNGFTELKQALARTQKVG